MPRQDATSPSTWSAGRGAPLLLDMIATDFPIPATHHYRMKPQKVADLRRMAERSDLASALSGARQASAPVAAMLLEQVAYEIRPSELFPLPAFA